MSSNTILIITDCYGVPLINLKENLTLLENIGYTINKKNQVPVFGIAFSFRRTEIHTQIVAHSHCKKTSGRADTYYFIYNYDRPDVDILIVLNDFIFKAEDEIKNHNMEILDEKDTFFLFKNLKRAITNNRIPHNDTKLIEAVCKCFDVQKHVQLEAGGIEKSVNFLVELCPRYEKINYIIPCIDDPKSENTGTIRVNINQGKGNAIRPAKQFEIFYKEQIKRDEQLTNYYNQGMSAYNSKDWVTAIAAFEQVMTIDPEYRDSSKLLLSAREEKQLFDNYSRGISAFNSGAMKTYDQKKISNSIGMDFVLIPAGEFDMGSPSNEMGRYDYEGPVHHVKIGKAFNMGKYEVTQKQWREVMGNNPSRFKGDDQPVENVSWNDVWDFIKKLNEKEVNGKYRLPSEAEWEYAARAGTKTRYSFGDDESRLGEYAWYDANAGGKTHKVGQKKPNPWGLHDMHGNVWEWVQDKWHSDYNGAPTDEIFWGSWGGSKRVDRGGGWAYDARGCRSAVRYFIDSALCGGALGFRLVRES